MPAASRKDDVIKGNYASEHSGHDDPHSGGPITGKISSGSGNVFINGKPAATKGDSTEEHDDCCGVSSGVIKIGSSTVFINGKPAARKGDSINPHNGTAVIDAGSPNVFIGG